jgi:hypothetical protein
MDALLSQVFFYGKRYLALESARREDVARMTGRREPLDNRAKTLRHASGRVADAVVVDEEKSHRLSVRTRDATVNPLRRSAAMSERITAWADAPSIGRRNYSRGKRARDKNGRFYAALWMSQLRKSSRLVSQLC